MFKIKIDNLNLKQIAISGQCFRMNQLIDQAGDSGTAKDSKLPACQENSAIFSVIAGDRMIFARQECGEQGCTEDSEKIKLEGAYGSAELTLGEETEHENACKGGESATGCNGELTPGEKMKHGSACGSAELTLSCDEQEWKNFWEHYFDADADYAGIIRSIDPKDAYLTAAAASCDGMRILNQDPWEMIVTFLISQQNNIPRIKKCVENICHSYGEKKYAIDFEGNMREFYAFPKPQVLAGLPEDELMKCNLGYRSKYVVRAAREVVSGELVPATLSKMSYDQAKARLLKLFGVGPKVADCICLFGLHQVDAFPIDTHVKQILARHYEQGFPFERYAGYAGILQQYMFYYDLHVGK